VIGLPKTQIPGGNMLSLSHARFLGYCIWFAGGRELLLICGRERSEDLLLI